MSNGPRDQLPGAPSRTPSPRDDRRGRLGWLLLPALALLPFVVFYRAALLRAVFFAYDVQNYFYAYLPIGPGAVRRGELPLWNPYAFSGMPLLADGQTALFYPPNWLFYVLPAAAALNYATLVQFAIASVGMFLFLRSLGLHRAPATLGAVAYTFCGFLSARIVHLSIMSGAALIPVAFLCVERAFRAQHDPAARPAAARRWVVAAAASVAAQAVAGHPQVPVLTAIALGLYSLVRAAEQRHRTGTVRALFRLPSTLVAIYVLGYGLAAIQLLPWLELARSSVRGAKAPFEFVFGAVMNRSDGLLQLFPFLFGTLQPGPPRAMSDAHVLAVRTWEHAAYIGMLPLGLAAFAALGLLRRPAGDRDELRTRYALLYLVLLLAVALVLAAGKATPVAHLVYLLPVIGKLREPARALALFDFSVAALAAFGLQRVAAAPLSPARGGPRSLALIGVLLAAVPCAAVWLAPQPWFQHALRLPPQAVEHLQWQRWTAQLPVAFALASAALLIWWSRRRATGFTRAAAVALVLLDVGTAAALFTPTADARYYERRPASLSALGGEPGTFRKTTYLPRADVDHATARESLAISWNMVYGVEDVNGFNSLQTRRYTDYLFGPGEDDVSYGALASEPLLRPESPILSSLNVKYLFVPAGLAPEVGSGYEQVYADDRVTVYENHLAYPRAFFADAARAEPDPAQVLRAVTSDGFDGRRLALLETDRVPAVAAATGRDLVSMTDWRPTRLSLATSTDGPRVLVLSEMYFPGWQALVDGTETPIYRANYLFRAVVVPGGRHAVVFVYRPRAVVWGAAASALAGAVALMLACVRRRASPPSPRPLSPTAA